MINLPVDEAYAFDYLSILNIKSDILTTKIVQNSLIKQLGHELYFEIIGSNEFQGLLMANIDVFSIVKLAYKNEVSASIVQELNYKRFECKQALQAKFFKTGLSEQKTK